MIIKVTGCTGTTGDKKCGLCDMMFDFKKCTDYRIKNNRTFLEQGRKYTRQCD